MHDNRAIKTDSERILAFVASDVFDKLFTEGMSLVEETASYLDGEGRQESKKLERVNALVYASESMRLTTRLMQAASWLLVQRALREGEMHVSDVRDTKYRVGAKVICAADGADSNGLPVKLVELLSRSRRLYDRIVRLDDAMFGEGIEDELNPVNAQLAMLQQAFGTNE